MNTSGPSSGKKLRRKKVSTPGKATTPGKAAVPGKASAEKKASSIGTKRESSLHRSLKFRYSGDGGEVEALAGNYVCDACTKSGELIEVQTGSFGPIREKIKVLARHNPIRIIYPIIVQKNIELYDTSGRLLRKRKSPRKGSIWDLFNALIYAPELPLLKKLTLELAVIGVVEKRIDDGQGTWRRKGVRISDRDLDTWYNSIVLSSSGDYYQFIPFGKTEQFTVRDLGARAGINSTLARKTLYALSKIELVRRVGKQGNALVYQIK